MRGAWGVIEGGVGALVGSKQNQGLEDESCGEGVVPQAGAMGIGLESVVKSNPGHASCPYVLQFPSGL